MVTTARALALEHFQWINGHADVWAIFRDPKRWQPWSVVSSTPFETRRSLRSAGSSDLRREIHGELQVVEKWNSANLCSTTARTVP
ncbi:hypothetical protein [Streptomyces sp. NPDC001020]